jgi:hypothetical protein
MLSAPARRVAWLAAVSTLAVGCANIPDMFSQESPAYERALATPASLDVRANFRPADQRHRTWETATVAAQPTDVVHGPLYFQDPIASQGATYANRWGWEDYAAAAYGPARFALNLVAFPVSAVVQPPWMPMASDGVLSRQALGYDHDAIPAAAAATEAPRPSSDAAKQPAPAAEAEEE